MSLRSVTQATDSTRNGWMANKAATKALGQVHAGHLLEDQEEQYGIGRVQQQVDQVMPARPTLERTAAGRRPTCRMPANRSCATSRSADASWRNGPG